MLLAALPAAVFAAGAVHIETSGAAPEDFTVAVVGLEREQIDGVGAIERGAWRDWFSLHVADPSNPPVAARYAVVADRVELHPRFPLERGLAYVVAFRPAVLAARLGGATGGGAEAAIVLESFELPRVEVTPTTRVTAIHPSAGVVPENLLKLYLHFSAPMTRGRAYRYVRILDARGREVELAFLELEYELWDRDGTRLTLLFDPGRLKAGLKPRREVGPALAGGFDFALEVDAAWPDAEGNPLRAGFVHELRVAPPDDEQPDPESWTWTVPRADTREPLVIELGEPLDGALLQHSLWVVELDARQPEGRQVARQVEGAVELAQGESVWRFTPAEPWRRATHELRVDPLLEDLAGNSIARPFEVDLGGTGAPGSRGETSARDAQPWRRSFVPSG